MSAKSPDLRQGGESTPAGLDAESSRQLVLEWEHSVSHALDDFITCAANRTAFDHVCAFPAWSSPLTLIQGPAKSGKSHLARIFAALSEARQVAREEIETLAAEGGRFPIVVEDVDRSGYLEVGLFHLLNQSMRDERPVLMTARLPIALWPYRTADVKSRARLASWFSIEAPDDILLSQMMVKLFADRQLAVDPKVISYMVARMERSSQEVVALVETVDRLSLSRGRAITRPIAAEALALRDSGRDRDAETDTRG
ncbi:HdaA/DnaA family protein [Pelagibacterium montanilacus]|uniref:HdaA/DnaA family protein n=1 Tax=Pelagibacterium montanilacus TaxID=2185280 RepID=UPI000F8E2153|nr:hypothetical protein [Pelagibacterium montanilacus]